MDDGSNSWTDKRKRDLVLDIIQGKSTAPEASRFYDLHPSTIEEWVENATQAMDDALQTPTSHEVYGRIEELGKRVAEAFDEEPTLEEIQKQVDSWLASGQTTMQITSGLANSAFEKNASHGCVEWIAMAYAFFLEGRESLRGQNPRLASGSFYHASKLCDGVEDKLESILDDTCATDEDYQKELDDRATAKAKMAGHARAEKRYGPIKTEFARLLNEKKPDGGWKSKAQVVRLLEADMTEFKVPLEDGRTLSLTPDNLHRTLAKWMREDTEIREAYENTRRRPVQS